MEESSKNSYKSILKGTSVFGGMQVFLILINLVRGKFVAMFLGPDGMGISSLLTSSTNTVVKASSLGLNLAIVKDVAAHKEQGNELGKLMCAVGKLVRLTAMAGCLLTLLCSSLLSEWAFGDSGYAWQFAALSVMVYLTILANGKMSVLQGLHEVRRLSKASVVGAFTGLACGVPLYYFFGTKGIVPAMIIFAAVNFLFYTVNLRRSGITAEVKISREEFKSIAKKLIAVGLILVAGDLVGTLVTYLINIFIRVHGSLDDVGLYQAANSITGQYTGAVFAAMSLDYFPRLAAEAADNDKMSLIVNRQSVIMALVLAPLSMLVILTAPLIIRILLTVDFLPILELIRWLGFAVLLKGLHFPLGYIAFAKDNRRLFFWLEVVVGNIITLAFSIGGFYLYGLVGLGIGVAVENLIVFLIYLLVNRKVYGFRLDGVVCKEYLTGVILSGTALLLSYSESMFLGPVLISVLTAASIMYSVLRLKKLTRAK